MEIKLNSQIDSVARLNISQPKVSRPVDSLSALSEFDQSTALEARLQELPNARSEKVAHARTLIGDPPYPPRETMQRFAALLAIEGNLENKALEN